MLKKSQLNTNENYQKALPFFLLSTVILFAMFFYFDKNIQDLGNGYHTINKRLLIWVPILLFTLISGFVEYKKELNLSRKKIHIHDGIQKCDHMIYLSDKTCKVVEIKKDLVPAIDVDGNQYHYPLYTVYFDFKDQDKIWQREAVRTKLDEGEEILTSLYFCFNKHKGKICIKNLDFSTQAKTHTMVKVTHDKNTPLRIGSRFGFEHIRDEDYYAKNS